MLWLLGAATATTASAIDLRRGRIPLWLTGGTALVALVWHGITHGLYAPGHGGLLWALGGTAVTAFVPWLLWQSNLRDANHKRVRAVGGGDVHLFAALGAVFGPLRGAELLLLSFAAAALWTLARLAWNGTFAKTLWNAVRTSVSPLLPQALRMAPDEHMTSRVAFAPAIALATLIVARHELWNLVD